MKKLAQILFILIYAQLMIGVTIANHFCGGELAWQSLILLEGLHNCGCVDEESCGCCETTYTQVRLNDEHLASEMNDGKTEFALLRQSADYSNEFEDYFETFSRIPVFELPPGRNPSYIINRSLLI